MNKKLPGARLLLVGEGGLMEQVKEKAAALGVLEQVIFTGNQGKVSGLLSGDGFLWCFPPCLKAFGIGN